MKIAIAADTPDLDAQVAEHAARAPFYMVYDEEGTFLDAIETPYAEVERGAAPKVTQLLQEHGVDRLIAGKFGARFVTELEENNITTVLGTGLVSSVIQKVIS